MKYPVNIKALAHDAEALNMNEIANVYLSGFNWYGGVINSSIYLNLGSTLCVFLFEIDNLASKEDSFLWVMVGDFPSIYLDVFGSKTTKEVLERYSALADDWVSKIEAGLSVDECYPFDANPTCKIASMLKKRISLMKNSIIPNIDDIELPPSLMSM